MKKRRNQHNARLVAIDPYTRGFGFVMFESSAALLDWGVARVRLQSRDAFLERLDATIARCKPVLILLADPAGTRRSARTVRRIRLVVEYGVSRGIDTRFVSRSDVHNCFADTGTTKYQISLEVARRLPELEQYLPRPRKPWMPEDDRMKIFDAAALALTVFDGFSEMRMAA